MARNVEAPNQPLRAIESTAMKERGNYPDKREIVRHGIGNVGGQEDESSGGGSPCLANLHNRLQVRVVVVIGHFDEMERVGVYWSLHNRDREDGCFEYVFQYLLRDTFDSTGLRIG